MFLRNCGQDLKAALIEHALALIYTPVNEHFGIVPIEAMALGRAVIAHDSGGPRESVVSGETGYLCANWEEFGNAMGKLAEDRKLGEKIDSKVMMAVFTDSMGDVITTSATILSLLFFAVTGINIDGFVGAGVALVVMWAGVGIARDTLEPLIGQAIDPEVYEEIKRFVENYDGIEGTHDLIVHNYGPGRSMASIHAEVPNDVDIEQSHEIIDRIEREAAKELGLFLVIHMDPVETKDENVLAVREDAVGFLKELDPACTLHDFRVVHGERQINLIFDMVVPIDYNDEKKEELKTQLAERLKKKDARYECVITVESDFVARVDEETKQE